MVKPFQEIDVVLLNDVTDASYLTLDGITLASANEIDLDDIGGRIKLQERIHDTVQRVADILIAYRNVYRKGG